MDGEAENVEINVYQESSWLHDWHEKKFLLFLFSSYGEQQNATMRYEII